MVEIDNVRTVKAAGRTLVYVGRGRAPSGMEQANLGNPFVVGAFYAQGEAAAAYRPHLAEKWKRGEAEKSVLIQLARRHLAGERLVLCCWCVPRPCHAQHIKDAVLGIAAKLKDRAGH